MDHLRLWWVVIGGLTLFSGGSDGGCPFLEAKGQATPPGKNPHAEKESPDLPEPCMDVPCAFINPIKDVGLWGALTVKNKCTYIQLAVPRTKEEMRRRDEGLREYSFDVLVSDKIGPRRTIPDSRHELCKEEKYDEDLPPASVVITYHNEALTVLIRMINGILDRTLPQHLHQIVLFDDNSKPDHKLTSNLKRYGRLFEWPMEKFRFIEAESRQGLIRARVLAAREATGEVLVFLDSHCEVGFDWLPPLLHRIKHSPKTIAVPVVDIIHPFTFNYSTPMVAKAGFTWSLAHEWIYFPWEYFNDPLNYVRPFQAGQTLFGEMPQVRHLEEGQMPHIIIPSQMPHRQETSDCRCRTQTAFIIEEPNRSPAMSGGLFAVGKAWFQESGEYDLGMDIWGAENVEFSIRTWMCGGKVENLPCSHVGHIFRYQRPYGNGPNNTDTMTINAIRTAKVWFDQYEKYHIHSNGRAKIYMDQNKYGDISERLELRKRLKCQDFQWYIDTVYPELLKDWPRLEPKKSGA